MAKHSCQQMITSGCWLHVCTWYLSANWASHPLENSFRSYLGKKLVVKKKKRPGRSALDLIWSLIQSPSTCALCILRKEGEKNKKDKHTTSKDLSVKQGLSRCLCRTGKIPHITHTDNHFQSFRLNLTALWIEAEKLNWLGGQIILGLKVCAVLPVIHPVTSKQKGQCSTQNNRIYDTGK